MDDSAITCDEVIESYHEDAEAKLYDETKTISTNFNEIKATCKTQNFYILLAFLSITIALLIAVSISCYLIKYRTKQKHLLPFYFTNNKLKCKKPHILLFNYIINIKSFDPNNIKINEKLYKNILIYYIGYVTIKDSK